MNFVNNAEHIVYIRAHNEMKLRQFTTLSFSLILLRFTILRNMDNSSFQKHEYIHVVYILYDIDMYCFFRSKLYSACSKFL